MWIGWLSTISLFIKNLVRKFTFRFAEIFVCLFTDIDVPSIQTLQYKHFLVDNEYSDFSINFGILKKPAVRAKKVPKSELSEQLISSVGFSPQWLDNEYSRHPHIIQILNTCAEHADHCQIEFLFDRIVIRDFLLKRINYFYSFPRSACFSDESFHAIFRNAFSSFMPLFSTFLLHGSAVTFPDGRASVFFAPDSGGKTTLVSQFNHDQILSDDQIFVKRSDNQIFVYSTPFGRYGHHKAQKGILSGLFLLKKTDTFSIIPIKPFEIVEFLMQEHRLLWYSIPTIYRKTVFNLLTDICYSVPTFLLTFPKVGIDWEAIKRVLKH